MLITTINSARHIRKTGTSYTDRPVTTSYGSRVYFSYYQRAGIEFDISAIPALATLTELKFLFQGYSYLYGSILTGINSQIASLTATELYNAINSGNVYLAHFSFTANPNQEVDLTETNALSDLQDIVGNDQTWFTLGIKEEGTALQIAEIYSHLNGSATPKPTLSVSYTLPVRGRSFGTIIG
jgi:hypothetical protein